MYIQRSLERVRKFSFACWLRGTALAHLLLQLAEPSWNGFFVFHLNYVNQNTYVKAPALRPSHLIVMFNDLTSTVGQNMLTTFHPVSRASKATPRTWWRLISSRTVPNLVPDSFRHSWLGMVRMKYTRVPPHGSKHTRLRKFDLGGVSGTRACPLRR